MKPEDLQKVVEQGSIGPAAPCYLTIYVGDADWSHEIKLLTNTLMRLYAKDKEVVSYKLRDVVSYTIMLPAVDRSTRIDPNMPETLLHQAWHWRQFHEKPWFDMFVKVVKKDLSIRTFRNQAIELGVLDNIDIHPYYRQAFNWIWEEIDARGHVTEDNKQNYIQKVTNLVKIYGGAVVCGAYSRRQEQLYKLPNWRSCYFFERLIHQVFTEEQIIKIKSAELEKVQIHS